MTFELFNSLCTISFRLGIGIDMSFPKGEATWLTKNGKDLQVALFSGFTLLLPYLKIRIGNYYIMEDV